MPAAQFSGAAPDWLVTAASFALALLIAAIIVAIIWAILQKRRQPEKSLSLERIAEQADEARETIEAGGDLHDTIIRCYKEMNEVVRQARGIRRQEAVTPSEFEKQLEDAGLPPRTGGRSDTPLRGSSLRIESVGRMGRPPRHRLPDGDRRRMPEPVTVD